MKVEYVTHIATVSDHTVEKVGLMINGEVQYYATVIKSDVFGSKNHEFIQFEAMKKTLQNIAAMFASQKEYEFKMLKAEVKELRKFESKNNLKG